MSNMKDRKEPHEKAEDRERIIMSAIDPYVEIHIVKPTEEKMRGKNVISWGEDNDYPQYLLDLYENVPTLMAIIDGCTDYVVGNDVTTILMKDMNRAGDTIRDIVKKIAFDYWMYGGFALQVIRSKDGKDIAEVNYIDIRYIRSNKKNDVFFYNENWGDRRGKDAIIYPKFLPNPSNDPEVREQQKSSIVFVKRSHKKTYPAPVWAAAVIDCEIERCIGEYHLNAINNGFSASAIVNFNNGNPTDEQKREIARDMKEKFTGHQNSGRLMLSWNLDVKNRTTIDKFDAEDFGEKYASLEKFSKQEIFTAFRANPNLFGIPTENLGFSKEEYESAFDLFNRTMIQPVQAMIVDTFDKIFGVQNSITIVPFCIPKRSE